MIYLLEVSFGTAIFYLVFHVLFRNSTNHFFNRFYLLGSLVLALILPLIHLPIFPEYVLLTQQSGTTLSTVPPNASAFTWQKIVLGFYVLGLTINLFIFVKSLSRIYSIISKGVSEKCEKYTKIFTDSGASLSSFSHFLIIPLDLKNKLMTYQLQHEKSHIQQGHTWDIIFIELLKSFLWFNPLLLLYKKSLVEVHEFLADQSVSHALGKVHYESFLIQQVSQKLQPHLVHHFYSLFEKRIIMMNSSNPITSWKYFMILPLLALSLFLFSFETYSVTYLESDEIVVAQDTIPKVKIDTVSTYDPVTGEKRVTVVRLVDEESDNSPLERQVFSGIDTVITFDPKTGKEQVTVVRLVDEESDNSTLEKQIFTGIDTVTFFDPDTFKETIIRVDNATGKVDTLKKE